jgi:hypothetical protein
MKEQFTTCSICKTTIYYGDIYGTMVFNKERITNDNGHTSIEILASREVHTLCNRCSDKMDLRDLLD